MLAIDDGREDRDAIASSAGTAAKWALWPRIPAMLRAALPKQLRRHGLHLLAALTDGFHAHGFVR